MRTVRYSAAVTCHVGVEGPASRGHRAGGGGGGGGQRRESGSSGGGAWLQLGAAISSFGACGSRSRSGSTLKQLSAAERRLEGEASRLPGGLGGRECSRGTGDHCCRAAGLWKRAWGTAAASAAALALAGAAAAQSFRSTRAHSQLTSTNNRMADGELGGRDLQVAGPRRCRPRRLIPTALRPCRRRPAERGAETVLAGESIAARAAWLHSSGLPAALIASLDSPTLAPAPPADGGCARLTPPPPPCCRRRLLQRVPPAARWIDSCCSHAASLCFTS